MQVFIHACRKVNGRWQNVRVAVRVAVSIQFFVLAVQLSSVCCYTHSCLWCCACHVCLCYYTAFMSVLLHTVRVHDACFYDALHTIRIWDAAYHSYL